ncbi:hypothetical protein C882_3189 [Caenispirillum salinarum AK4]|uniref:Uncharacterized protein n=1 Tax=Caenispirillum salinarum AK4 TaxID=1238182 RepID=K9H1N1_9PROT|nr:hypothetical protein [Caenispirillum salinarum]EKV32125.1 hypothetical protein C882_3189 [Caenispirillum salinarum AK4]
MTPFLRRLLHPVPAAAATVAAVLALGAAGPVAAAEGGGSSGGMDRGDVAELAGQYILLDPLWIPIEDVANRRTYHGGLLVRLEPNPERKVDACYAVPDVVDALVVDFFHDRMTRSEHQRPGYVAKRIQDVVEREAGKDVFDLPQVFDQVPEMDDNSIKLSRTCQ